MAMVPQGLKGLRDVDVTSAEASYKDKLRSVGDEDRVCRERERGLAFQDKGTVTRRHRGGTGGFEDLHGVTMVLWR